MGRKSGWWDDTANWLGGCYAKSPGCRNCYAAKLAATQQFSRGVELYQGITKWVRGKPVFNGETTILAPDHPDWKRWLTYPGVKHPNLGPGMPSLIFVADMCDLFYDKRRLNDIDQVTSMVSAVPNIIGLLQSKYTERMAEYFLAPRIDRMREWRRKMWLGFSAERQIEFDARWEDMRQLSDRGWLTFVAIAPMLAPVALPDDFLARGDRVWVIVSGEQARDEQGRPPRPLDPDWARHLRDQCKAAGIPFFLNQMSHRGRIPPDLFIREWPPC